MVGADAQRSMLNFMLSLPNPVLRMMSGAIPAHLGGRTLDPRLQFIAAMASRTRAAGSPATPDAIRKAFADGLATIKPPLEPGVAISFLSVESADGPIPCRVYRPDDQDPDMPVLVYGHMGGGVIGDLETCDVFCSMLAAIIRCPVISVDYRLAPEHRFPAGLEDMLAVFRHARDRAGDFGAPAGKASIGGDSMGGNFAAAVCLMLKAAGEAQPCLQLAIYPAVDIVNETQSERTYADAFPLTRDTMKWFMANYLNAADSPADPRISPLLADSLEGLAPAVVVTAGFDVLHDQGEAYAKALSAAGAPTVYRSYDCLFHGFTAYTGVSPAADTACREIAGLAREGLKGRIPVK